MIQRKRDERIEELWLKLGQIKDSIVQVAPRKDEFIEEAAVLVREIWQRILDSEDVFISDTRLYYWWPCDTDIPSPNGS